MFSEDVDMCVDVYGQEVRVGMRREIINRATNLAISIISLCDNKLVRYLLHFDWISTMCT